MEISGIMARHKYTYAQQICIKKAGLALQKSHALWPGCRVGIAISGGVDSFTLLKIMKIRQGIIPFPFEIMAIHCNPGFDRADHAPLGQWVAQEGIASHVEIGDFGPLAHSAENSKNSPCFLCAWHRRKRMFALCEKYHLTHLAIGHNADDLLATFLLNFCRNGRLATTEVDEAFFQGKLHVIRPLLWVEKKYIRQAARQWHLPIWENACPTSGKTARDQTGGMLDAMRQFVPDARKSMLNALIRWQMEKMPQP